MFENPFLDMLTKTHIAFPLTIFPVFSAIVVYKGISTMGLLPLETAAIVFLGFFLFTLLEYLVHRNIFHLDPTTDLRKKIQYNFHGIHHAQPKDKQRLAMPVIVSTVLAFVLLGGFYLVMGKYAFAFAPGFVMGYATYLAVHYSIHAFKAPKGLLKILWVNHSIHHFKDSTVAFGVSSPFWDVIFRTLPPGRKIDP